MVAPAPYLFRAEPMKLWRRYPARTRTLLPLFLVSVRAVNRPLATDGAVQSSVCGLISGRTAGLLSSSLSRLNFPFALKDNYYEYVPPARNYKNECRVVYVACTDSHRLSALISCPLLRSARPQIALESDRQSGKSRPRLLSSSCVGPALCGNPAPRFPLHWNLPRGFPYLSLMSPRLPPTVNAFALVPRSSLAEFLSYFSAFVAIVAIFNAFSIFSGICNLFPWGPHQPIYKGS